MQPHQDPLDLNHDRQGANHGDEGASNMTNGDSKNKSEGAETGPGSLEEKMQQLTQELDDTKDKYLRSVAEMDNMRKRHAKERSDYLRYGAENLLRDLLPALDSLDQACQEGVSTGSAEEYLKGMQMVRKQLFDTLARHGVKPVEGEGHPFDPNVHQAIQRIDCEDAETEKVHQEFARGYTYNDRLLRPAMVAVAVPHKKSDES